MEAIVIKGIKLTDKGDISITNHEIDIVKDGELLKQTAQQVLGTNKGEWVFNTNEGINFKNILGKHKDKTAQTQESAAMK